MLVLSRHRDERIMLGDDIVITIVDIRGDKIRIGIDAPSSMPVHRQEVYEAIHRGDPRHAAAAPKASTDVKPATIAGYAQRVLKETADPSDIQVSP
jgi:carbon storage regulator